MKKGLNVALALCLPFIIACESSLDLDTNRIEDRSPLIDTEPILKISELSVTTSVTGFLSQAPTAWNYIAQVENFSVDMSTTPPTFSMDYVLEQAPGAPTSDFVLDRMQIGLQDVLSDGNNVTMTGDPNIGTGFSTSGSFTVGGPPVITFTTAESQPNSVLYTATGNFNYVSAPSPELTGDINVSMQLPQNTQASLTISFTADEE